LEAKEGIWSKHREKEFFNEAGFVKIPGQHGSPWEETRRLLPRVRGGRGERRKSKKGNGLGGKEEKKPPKDTSVS